MEAVHEHPQALLCLWAVCVACPPESAHCPSCPGPPVRAPIATLRANEARGQAVPAPGVRCRLPHCLTDLTQPHHLPYRLQVRAPDRCLSSGPSAARHSPGHLPGAPTFRGWDTASTPHLHPGGWANDACHQAALQRVPLGLTRGSLGTNPEGTTWGENSGWRSHMHPKGPPPVRGLQPCT